MLEKYKGENDYFLKLLGKSVTDSYRQFLDLSDKLCADFISKFSATFGVKSKIK